MYPTIKSDTTVSTALTKSMAIQRASLSAVVIFCSAAAIAGHIGMRFPPLEWAGIVIGVTILVWRRPLLS